MARKDKGRKEVKRPKQDKAKAAGNLSERPPLPHSAAVILSSPRIAP